jgi:hypothetical protein
LKLIQATSIQPIPVSTFRTSSSASLEDLAPRSSL